MSLMHLCLPLKPSLLKFFAKRNTSSISPVLPRCSPNLTNLTAGTHRDQQHQSQMCPNHQSSAPIPNAENQVTQLSIVGLKVEAMWIKRRDCVEDMHLPHNPQVHQRNPRKWHLHQMQNKRC